MAASPWKLDSIATGVERFDSIRLTYAAGDSPLRFEIMAVNGGVETFLNLTRHKFTPKEAVKVEISIGGEKSIETIPLLEGKMRLRFPLETTERLLGALQEGQEVAIMVDGFEARLSPEGFERQYENLLECSPFKGLF
jgi:hypothetical protein